MASNERLRLTPREKARLATVAEIKAVARRQLEEVGSAALSLRAVARELGLVSSALYRYFPSRDELLTELIVDAYNDLGEATEQADAAVDRANFMGRWMAAGSGVRRWALDNSAQYALLYGSPVPGYHAPAERTVLPATRVAAVMVRLLADASDAGVVTAPPPRVPMSVALMGEVLAAGEALGHTLDPVVLGRGLVAWMQVFGAVNFEVFGQLDTVITQRDEMFAYEMAEMAAFVGIEA